MTKLLDVFHTMGDVGGKIRSNNKDKKMYGINE